MTAEEAKIISKWMKFLKDLEKDIEKLPLTLQIIWKNILWAIKDGKTRCEIPHLPQNVQVALKSKNFKIIKKTAGSNVKFLVIWDGGYLENKIQK